jgi:hypothetical protein
MVVVVSVLAVVVVVVPASVLPGPTTRAFSPACQLWIVLLNISIQVLLKGF